MNEQRLKEYFPRATGGKAVWGYLLVDPAGMPAQRHTLRVLFPEGAKMAHQAFFAACQKFLPPPQPGWRRDAVQMTDPVNEEYMECQATDVPEFCPHCGRGGKAGGE